MSVEGSPMRLWTLLLLCGSMLCSGCTVEQMRTAPAPMLRQASFSVSDPIALSEADPQLRWNDGLYRSSLSVNAWAAFLDGTVEVREFDIQGTRLEVPQDLAMDRVTNALGLRYQHLLGRASRDHLRPVWSYDLGLDLLHTQGTTTLEKDITFNKFYFPAGETVETSGTLVILQLFFDRLFTWDDERTKFQVGVGMVYPRLMWGVNSELQRDTEDWKQTLPSPALRLQAERQLTARLSLRGLVLGTSPSEAESTHQTEGGTITQTSRYLEFSLGLRWQLGRRWWLNADYRDLHYAVDLQSWEDGNYANLRFRGPALSVSRSF